MNKVGKPVPLLQVAQKVEDLGLHRNVERGHGLVGTISDGCTASARAIPTRCR